MDTQYTYFDHGMGAEVRCYASTMPDIGGDGIVERGQSSVSAAGDKIDQLTTKHMRENNELDYQVALQKVLDANPALAERYLTGDDA